MSTLATAIAYAEIGLHVFALAPRSKEPATAHGLKDATVDFAAIRGMWRNPDNNVAIATGDASEVIVLDVDGEEGALNLQALEAMHGAMPDTPEVITSRGRHLYFRYPGAELRIGNSASKIAKKLDVRGIGGYVVAPPSVHPSGERYRWAPGRAPTELAFALPPDWLIEKLVAKPKPRAPEPTYQQSYTGHTRFGAKALADECAELGSAPEGTRNDKLNGVAFRAGQLCRAGHLNEGAAEADIRRAARACGLDDREIEKTMSGAMEAGWNNPNPRDPVPTFGERRTAHTTPEAKPESKPEPPKQDPPAERKPLAITLTAEETAMRALEWLADESRATMPRSGFDLLDHAIGGLPPGAMLTVGGRTGSGKSSLLLGMAMHQSRQQSLKVGIVSCEDPEWVWGSRIISVLQGVNPEEFFAKQPSDYIVGKARVAVNEAKQYGMHFSFQIGRKVEAVLAAVKELVIGKGCQVIMVDYLQAIAAPGANRYEARTDHAQALKGFCHDRGVPLVLASQLKRPADGAVGKEPSSNDLKDSGDVENMSEAVILLWPVSDEENAPTLGKVSKVKWSPKRTKFALHRNPESGALVSLIEPPPPPPKPEEMQPGAGFMGRGPERRRGWP